MGFLGLSVIDYGDYERIASGPMAAAEVSVAWSVSRVVSVVGTGAVMHSPGPSYARHFDDGEVSGEPGDRFDAITLAYLGGGMAVRLPQTGLEAQLTLGLAHDWSSFSYTSASGGHQDLDDAGLGYSVSVAYSWRVGSFHMGPYLQWLAAAVREGSFGQGDEHTELRLLAAPTLGFQLAH